MASVMQENAIFWVPETPPSQESGKESNIELLREVKRSQNPADPKPTRGATPLVERCMRVHEFPEAFAKRVRVHGFPEAFAKRVLKGCRQFMERESVMNDDWKELSSAGFVENNFSTFSTELYAELVTPPDDVELGLVEIAIGSADNDEMLKDREQSPCPPLHVADDSPSDDNNDENKRPATHCCDTNDKECSHHDHGPADLTTSSEPPSQPVATPASPPTTVGGVAVAATEQMEEVMEMVEEYFGITDSRERGTTCDICLLDFEVDEEVAWWSPNPDCVHSFHKECIRDWLIGYRAVC